LNAQEYRDNVTLGNVPVCDIFAIEQNNSAFDYVVKGGFVASSDTKPFSGGKALCQADCVNDDKCIAAYFNVLSPADDNFGTCRIFHYSDQIADDWSHYCGFALDGVVSCIGSLSGNQGHGWYVRIPAGQTADNCPGAAPIP
jgi:hypothetical protein